MDTLEAWSLESVAMDLADAITATIAATGSKSNEEDNALNLFAVGAATRVVQRFLQLNATATTRRQHIRSYILDTLYPMTVNDRDTRFGAVADRLLAACENQPKCRQKFPTNTTPREALMALYKAIDDPESREWMCNVD
ncbi:hypothetical protein PINS_up013885 [Pythium insidiosum]|nr:hypothetical protein PINS_up013885 [Pythium insidiosum]